ncbi:uncharacterized protein [Ambystoma mexicanum]|uniref:uncharacterized protein n=1 Tax=Ambystoma mexicanum TaxID=8296 RepID=UPI0037E8F77A
MPALSCTPKEQLPAHSQRRRIPAESESAVQPASPSSPALKGEEADRQAKPHRGEGQRTRPTALSAAPLREPTSGSHLSTRELAPPAAAIKAHTAPKPALSCTPKEQRPAHSQRRRIPAESESAVQPASPSSPALKGEEADRQAKPHRGEGQRARPTALSAAPLREPTSGSHSPHLSTRELAPPAAAIKAHAAPMPALSCTPKEQCPAHSQRR